MLEATATKLIEQNGVVCGVEYKERHDAAIKVDGVGLSGGGGTR